MYGCLPSEAERLSQRGEMLFFFSEYLLGLSVVHSSLRNPLALPVLALFSVSFFLYPLSLAPGQHLTFTTGEQKYSIFLPSQGTSSLRRLCEVRDAEVSSETLKSDTRPAETVQPARRVSRGECSFVKCLWTGTFRFGAFFPVNY